MNKKNFKSFFIIEDEKIKLNIFLTYLNTF